LAQGNDTGTKETDIIDFIYQKEVLLEKDITYATFVYNYRSLK